MLAKAIEEIDPESRDGGMRFGGSDMEEVKELIWDRMLERGLSAVEMTGNDIGCEPKSVDWRVAITCAQKRQTSAPDTGIREGNAIPIQGITESFSIPAFTKWSRWGRRRSVDHR